MSEPDRPDPHSISGGLEESSEASQRDVTSVSITSQVYQQLRDWIITGNIAPDERLKVESLKQRLNVGASPIREALSLLTSDQLVERLDQRGFRVASVSEAHFREILTLRCQLEELALRASIQHGDTQWEEQLVLSHHRLARAERQSVEQWEQLHKAFHRTLISACDSPILLRFCDQLYDLNIRYRFLAVQSLKYRKRNVTREHEQLMQAAVDRRITDAVVLLREHYTRTGDYLVDQLTGLETHRS